VFGVVGSITLLALTVYPFSYDLVESTLLVGGLLVFMLFETVLNDISF
jgi:hypothetical protein